MAEGKTRVEILMTLDLDACREFLGAHYLPDDSTLMLLHKARYERAGVPMNLRLDSGRWLLAHGFTRIDGRPVKLEADFTCTVCGGNDADMPCAYPGDKKKGCLRDVRLQYG